MILYDDLEQARDLIADRNDAASEGGDLLAQISAQLSGLDLSRETLVQFVQDEIIGRPDRCAKLHTVSPEEIAMGLMCSGVVLGLQVAKLKREAEG